MTPTAEEFVVRRPGLSLRGTSEGHGADVLLLHGLSATRDYVVHGSRHIPRSGFRLHLVDARGHGSSDAAPNGTGYGYQHLIDDLDAVVETVAPGRPLVIGGHSMGCHTAAGWALRNPDRVRALILAGPVFGLPSTTPPDDRWDRRAEALEHGGPEAFAKVLSDEFAGGVEEAELLFRLARDRAAMHQDPAAVAEALKQVPRSRPFSDLGDLAALEAPVLVVGSRDDIDPGHPLAVAEAWCETIPEAELVVEEAGDSPLPWQGGRLSREIVAFLERSPGPEESTG